jgi:hypothetical protein
MTKVRLNGRVRLWRYTSLDGKVTLDARVRL